MWASLVISAGGDNQTSRGTYRFATESAGQTVAKLLAIDRRNRFNAALLVFAAVAGRETERKVNFA